MNELNNFPGDPINERNASSFDQQIFNNQELLQSKDQERFTSLLSDFVANIISQNNWKFYVNDEPIETVVFASNSMMLPVILWQAEKTHQMLCGGDLGVKFKSDETCGIGAKAVIDSKPGISRASFPLFCLEVLVQALEKYSISDPDSDITPEDIMANIQSGSRMPPKGAACSVDHLIVGFQQDQTLGLIPWTADSNPKAPNITV